jgi:hypothetical protein
MYIIIKMLLSKTRNECFEETGRAGINEAFLKSKRASITTGPLLTNPLNSSTKLQICATLQNYFFGL